MADIIVQNAIGKVTEAINSGASGINYNGVFGKSLIDKVKKDYSLQLIEPILKRWINHLLYKAPDDDGKNAGLRYLDVMKSFNESKMATDNLSKSK